MSLRKFVRNLLNSVGDFLKSLPKEIREFSDEALKVTTAIKNALESDTAITIVNMIPGDLDDKLRHMAVEGLKAAINALHTDPCKDKTNPDEMLRCYIDQLKNGSKHVRDMNLSKLQSLLIAYFNGNTSFTQMKEYDKIAQDSYIASAN